MIMTMTKMVVCVGLMLAGACAYAAGQTGTRYNDEEDAAVAMAKAWQQGKKAKPLMSDDGKIVFPFGQSMPKLTCSPTRACDVEMQPGENIRQVTLGDKQNWTSAAMDSVEKGKTIQHIVIQPRDKGVESNAIITTDRRTYHIKLFSPNSDTGVYLNRVGFYYPQDLVESWQSSAAATETTQKKLDALRVTEEPVSPEDYDSDYSISGDAEFKPVRVFNTGKKVYIEFAPSLFRGGEVPGLMLFDDDDKSNVVDVHPKGRFFIVDTLFTKAELVLGKQKVVIRWRKKAGWFWGGSGGGA